MITFLENIGNMIQNAVLAVMVLYLLLQSRKVDKTSQRALYFMAGGLFCHLLGNIFWTLYLLIRNELSPQYVSASDVAAIGGYLFYISVYILCLHRRMEERKPWKLWIMPLFVLLNVVLWMVFYGDYILNLLWGIPMIILAWYASYGIWQSYLTGQKELLPFYLATQAFLVVEMILFISQSRLYDIMNFGLTFVFVFMTVALERGVRRCCI